MSSHSSVTPESTEVERDNVVTETHDIAVFTPRLSVWKMGRSHVALAWQADYVMDGVNCETNR